MIFLIIEIYMILIVLSTLIVLSLNKEGQKNIMQMLMLCYVIVFFMLYDSSIEVNIFIWNYSLKLGYFEIILKAIVIFFILNYNYVVKDYFKFERIYVKEFMLMILIAIIGVFFIIMSNEFFLIYLALELTNLVFYTLTSLRRWRSKSIESGLKYYIMGSFSSGLLLYGIIMLFGYCGTLDFVEMSYLIKDILFLDMEVIYLNFVCFFIVVGLLFKLGVAPFHWWVPEVYEGAPIIVTLFFAIIPKISLLIILYKFFFFVLIYLNFFYYFFFFIVSFLSLLIGFFFSLYQKKIIKFLAYSSIFHVGFLMACFANGTYLSLISIFYFFLPYMFLLLGIFFILVVFCKIKNERFVFLGDLSLLVNSNKSLGFILSLFFFSLAGIPPLSGFFGKFFILFSIFIKSNIFLFFILLSFSVISSFYYFRIIRFFYFSTKIDYIFVKPYLSSIFLSIFGFFSVLFFIFFDFLFLFFLF